MSEKRSRAERDYGLPRLTITEAERVLGVSDAEFMAFLYALRPSPTRFSRWKDDVEPLPEVLIRMFLTHRLQDTVAKAERPPKAEGPSYGGQLRAPPTQRRRGGAQ